MNSRRHQSLISEVHIHENPLQKMYMYRKNGFWHEKKMGILLCVKGAYWPDMRKWVLHHLLKVPTHLRKTVFCYVLKVHIDLTGEEGCSAKN